MSLNSRLNLSDLTIDNIGTWPLVIKAVLCSMIFASVLFLGYYFDIADQSVTLQTASNKEVGLRSEFENKQSQSASLQAYKLQLQEIKLSFGALLKQLPSKTEVPGLLEDISKSGIASGLEFRSFNPGAEERHDFYAELPITIEVVGTYHQLGEFVSKVSALDRIVTLHDFQIKKLDAGIVPAAAPAATKADQVKPSSPSPDMLSMQVTAKTYRYMDDIEAGAPKNAK